MLKPIAGSAKKYLTTILTIVVVIVVLVVLYKFYKTAKTGSIIIGEELGKKYVENTTGVPGARQEAIKQYAKDLDEAVYRVPLTGYILWVTDDTVVAVLNKLVNAAEAILISDYYKQLTGDSLRSGVLSTKVFTEHGKINPVILQALK